jgi:hypothetical protein
VAAVFGVVERSDVLRHRWQGPLGPNAWITISLTFVVAALLDFGLRRMGCVESYRSTIDADLWPSMDGRTVELCARFGQRWRDLDELAWPQLLGGVGCVGVGAAIPLRFHPSAQFASAQIRSSALLFSMAVPN